MAVAYESAVWEEVLAFLASIPTAEEILTFKPSEALQHRASYLLEQNREGLLTPDERQEMDEFRRMNHFVSMLKLRTRQRLAQS